MKIQNGTDFIQLNFGRPFDDGFDMVHMLVIKAQVSFLQVSFDTHAHQKELLSFYTQLAKCLDKLEGVAYQKSFSFEEDFSLKISFESLGHATVEMDIKSNDHHGNKCSLCFETDQTYLTSFANELKMLLDL